MESIIEDITEDGKKLIGRPGLIHHVLELDINSEETGVVSVVSLLSLEELNEYFNKVKVSGNSIEVMKMIQLEKKELIRYKITDLTKYLNYIRSISG